MYYTLYNIVVYRTSLSAHVHILLHALFKRYKLYRVNILVGIPIGMLSEHKYIYIYIY